MGRTSRSGRSSSVEHQGLGGPHRKVIKAWMVLVGGSPRSERSSWVEHQGLGGPHR